MLVVVGPGWIDARDEAGERRLTQSGDVVRREVAAGLQRDIVVPVLLDGARMPKPHELPEDLVPLWSKYAIHARSDDVVAAIRKIVETLEARGVVAKSPERKVRDGVQRRLLRRSARRLRGELRARGYRASDDVRRASVEIPSFDRQDVTILEADRGHGATWALCRFLDELDGASAIVLLDSCGESRGDERSAASYLWNELLGDPDEPTLERVAEHLGTGSPSLVVAVDAVRVPSCAIELARRDWSATRMRLVMVCSPDVARRVEEVEGERVVKVTVPRFSFRELERYLERAGFDGSRAPGDVREVLRTPRVAAIAVDLARRGRWTPELEYELVSRVWNERSYDADLSEDEVAELHARLLYAVAGPRYAPPNLDTLKSSSRLLRAGALVERDGHLALESPRLESWAVAEALVVRLRGDPATLDELARLVASSAPERPPLGYLAADVMVQLAAAGMESQLRTCLSALAGSRQEGEYCEYVLPTLGAPGRRALFLHLKASVLSGGRPTSPMVRGLARGRGPDLAIQACELLRESDYSLRVVGARLAVEAPSRSALDGLWELRREVKKRDTQVVFQALRQCVRLDRDWLEAKLSGLDLVQVAAYLLAGLRDADDLWRKWRSHLIRTVPRDDERCLSHIMARYGEEADLEWLRSRGELADAFVAGPVLAALAKIDPDEALRALSKVRVECLGFSRRWWFSSLLDSRPDDLRRVLLDRMRSDPRPTLVLEVYRGHEHAMDVETYRFLLDLSVRMLRAVVAAPGSSLGALYHCFRAIAAPLQESCVHELVGRADSELEELLVEWLLRRGGRKDVSSRREEALALSVLEQIDGKGALAVVEGWLDADSPYAWLDAIESIRREGHANAKICRLLAVRATGTGQEGLKVLAGSRAVVALAGTGAWEDVVTIVADRGLGVDPEVVGIAWNAPGRPSALGRAALSRWRDQGPSAGAALALGIAGSVDGADSLRHQLRSAPGDSDMAMACVIALGLLGDRSEEFLDGLRRALAVGGRHRDWAATALEAMDEDFAREWLVLSLEDKYDDALAARLWRYRGLRKRVAQVQWREYTARRFSAAFEHWPETMSWCGEPNVVPFLEEVAFGSGPAHFDRASAIRGLARLDVELAGRAAMAALMEDRTSTAWMSMPSILAESSLGRDTLIELALEISSGVDERVLRDDARLRRIGDALVGRGEQEQVLSLIRSGDRRARLVGCMLAGVDSCTETVTDELRTLALYRDDLGSEARAALDKQARIEWIGGRAEAWDAYSQRRRWGLLRSMIDALVEGVDGRMLPETHLESRLPKLSHEMGTYLLEEIGAGRQELDRKDGQKIRASVSA